MFKFQNAKNVQQNFKIVNNAHSILAHIVKLALRLINFVVFLINIIMQSKIYAYHVHKIVSFVKEVHVFNVK